MKLFDPKQFYKAGDKCLMDGRVYTATRPSQGKAPTASSDSWKAGEIVLPKEPVKPSVGEDIKAYKPVRKEQSNNVKEYKTIAKGNNLRGPKGDSGKDGKDAISIKGDKGDSGKDGLSIVGPKGDKGDKGDRGDDGQAVGLDFKWKDTSLGIKREDEEEYKFVDLKGEAGSGGGLLGGISGHWFKLNSHTPGVSLLKMSTPARATLKSLVAGSNITLTDLNGQITIASSGGGGGSGTPAGADGDVQFNDSGSFGADTGLFTYDIGNGTLKVPATFIADGGLGYGAKVSDSTVDSGEAGLYEVNGDGKIATYNYNTEVLTYGFGALTIDAANSYLATLTNNLAVTGSTTTQGLTLNGASAPLNFSPNGTPTWLLFADSALRFFNISNSTQPLIIGSDNSFNLVATQAVNIIQGRATTGVGNTLTIQSGGAQSGASNTAGGDLIHSSGIATGSGGSGQQFWTVLAGQAGGSSDRNPTRVMNLTGADLSPNSAAGLTLGTSSARWGDAYLTRAGIADTDNSHFLFLKTGTNLSADRVLTITTGDAARAAVMDADFTISNLNKGSFGLTVDGGGAVVTTGQKGYVVVPFAMTITKWTILADVSGSCVVDVWKKAFSAGSHPTVANTITASAKPTLTTATSAQSSTLTGWTTSVAAGDEIGWNVDSASSVKRITIIIEGNKT